MLPRPTINAFDTFLNERGLLLEAVVIGGSALVLLGVTTRQTRDVDVLAPLLSEDVLNAARGFAQQLREDGTELADDWLNNGPISLGDSLPSGWQQRTRPAYDGNALHLTTLGREDLLKTKLFGLCDRGTDLADCVALCPTAAELKEATPWIVYQDANPLWPEHVQRTLDDLARRLDHGV